jgi:hypothetical protein
VPGQVAAQTKFFGLQIEPQLLLGGVGNVEAEAKKKAA